MADLKQELYFSIGFAFCSEELFFVQTKEKYRAAKGRNQSLIKNKEGYIDWIPAQGRYDENYAGITYTFL
ncbi:MAG: hypothetical protein DRQ48_02010 [Gammaproteobacteria bacterium]|nr:MAG: hypothetical protein DRQ58_00815 [Gammaproteobacteria bacterium]RKZ71913.1 MAG: hypothetical protein DRQ48_02010 [Gammaproteobacteria bacterium]